MGGCPGCPGGMQAVAVGCRRGGLWGCSVLCSARQQEFRKPTRGECQVRLYRSQTPACLLVLLEPVSDLISLGGSCLINTHLAARRPHRPYIVSLPCSQLCGTLQECCWGGSPGGRLAVGPGAGWGGLGFVGRGRLQFKLRTRGMGLCCRRSPGCCPHLPARCRGAPRRGPIRVVLGTDHLCSTLCATRGRVSAPRPGSTSGASRWGHPYAFPPFPMGGGLAAEHPAASGSSVGPPQIHAVAVGAHPRPTSTPVGPPPTSRSPAPTQHRSIPSCYGYPRAGGWGWGRGGTLELLCPHTSRAPHGAGAGRQAAMPFVPLGTHGGSAALGFSLLFWKFKTFTGRPTRALPATERSIWLTPLLSLAAAPSCSSSAGPFLHPLPLFFFLSPFSLLPPPFFLFLPMA